MALALSGDDDESPAPTTVTTAPPDATTPTSAPAGPTDTPDTAAAPATTAPDMPTPPPDMATTMPDVTTTTAAADPAGGDAPAIADFRVVDQTLGTPCAATERRITLAWAVTGAESVEISGPGAPGAGLPASGNATVCRPQGDPADYSLTATSPGGTDSATVVA
jgi:hypothetical protein